MKRFFGHKHKDFQDLSDYSKKIITRLKVPAMATPKLNKIYKCVVCDKELMRWGKYCIDHRLMKK